MNICDLSRNFEGDHLRDYEKYWESEYPRFGEVFPRAGGESVSSMCGYNAWIKAGRPLDDDTSELWDQIVLSYKNIGVNIAQEHSLEYYDVLLKQDRNLTQNYEKESHLDDDQNTNEDNRQELIKNDPVEKSLTESSELFIPFESHESKGNLPSASSSAKDKSSQENISIKVSTDTLHDSSGINQSNQEEYRKHMPATKRRRAADFFLDEDTSLDLESHDQALGNISEIVSRDNRSSKLPRSADQSQDIDSSTGQRMVYSRVHGYRIPLPVADDSTSAYSRALRALKQSNDDVLLNHSTNFTTLPNSKVIAMSLIDLIIA